MSAEPRRFIWPPAPLPEEPQVPAAPPTTDERERDRDPAGILVSFERTWLDPVAEPFGRRADSIGWSRDLPDEFCDRCGHEIGEHEASEFGCAACRATRPAWDRFVRLGSYDPPLSAWIREIKFNRFHALARALGQELGSALIDAGCADLPSPVVVPVPVTARRRIARGIDHAASVSAGVCDEIGAPMRRWLRRAHRPSQRAVAMSGRVANVRGAFRVLRPGIGAGRSVILVDDVSTSGATARACARVLRSAGVPCVWVACLAVTREPERGVPSGGTAGAADVDNRSRPGEYWAGERGS